MADNFYRLIKLQTDIATPVFRDLLENCAKKDTSTGETYTTLQRYLLLKEPVIGKLFHNAKWKYDQIYPSGKPSSISSVSDGENLDVSMLSSLLLGLFRKGKTPILPSSMAMDVRNIKDVRNSNILAHGSSTKISSNDFENTWTLLENGILSVAGLIGSATYLDKVKTEIKQTLLSNMPGMWNTCAKWFTSVVEEQADTIRQMQTLIDTGTEMQRHPSGKDQKRFKTVNGKHKTLKHNFKTLMANSPTDGIALSTATAEIRQKLASNKLVIVTGDSDSQYESVALAAIKGMPDFDEEFCVAISDPQEWGKMEEELVRVVVFKDPFGSEEFDRIECSKMVETFERLIEKSKTRKMPVSFTTVILTQKRILKNAFSAVIGQEHELFGVICEPCKTGSDSTSPIDVEVEKMPSLRKKNQPRSQAMKNMLDMSSVYLEGLQKIEAQDKTKYAFGELKKNGCLVITGKEPSDVTLFVVNLATREKGKNTVVLRCPSAIKDIEIRVIDILIIDFFAGQFVLEKEKAKRWIDEFDLLYALSQSRKLSIIISSTKSVFDALKRSLPQVQPLHRLLSGIVDVTKTHVLKLIKLESDAKRDLNVQAVQPAPKTFGVKDIEKVIDTTLMSLERKQTSSELSLHVCNRQVAAAPNTKPLQHCQAALKERASRMKRSRLQSAEADPNTHAKIRHMYRPSTLKESHGHHQVPAAPNTNNSRQKRMTVLTRRWHAIV
ncbi:uncharacterized protein LOC128223062 [Mya arenaria]|uniref:uncharacterized protein LOC128223062 n=1 Tax=Mya arenaria TaxID=6604 RepID=UPI0022E3C13F|nr:uncharacterized protein LOC128223062 [Mya arenaria]